MNGFTNGVGSIVIDSNQSIVTNTNIGSGKPLVVLYLDDNSTFNAATNNNSLSATTAYLDSGTTLTLGTGSVNGTIQAQTTGSLGTLNFNDHNALGGNFGVGDFKLNTVNVATGKLLTIGNHDISATTIAVGTGDNTVTGNFTTVADNTLALGIVNSSIAGNITAAGVASINANTTLRLSLLGTPSLGSSYTIVSGGTGSSINKISNANIIVGNNTGNRSGNLKFTTSVSGNDLLVNVSAATADGITRNGSQFNTYDAIIDVDNASGNLLALQNYLDSSGKAIPPKLTLLNQQTLKLITLLTAYHSTLPTPHST